LDGGCPFYGLYECSDGQYVSVAALEEKFYAEFL
jgi:alpha-methylacyl-CoA racemase